MLNWFDYKIEDVAKGTVHRDISYTSTGATSVNNTVSDSENEQLKSEDDALSKNGWISPMDYFKANNTSSYLSEPTPTADTVQLDVMTTKNSERYKDDFWWCEDLHNWCVFEPEFNGGYYNRIMLKVWNGKNNFVPLTASDGWYVDPSDEANAFAPLQNKFLAIKYLNKDYIHHRRGSHGENIQYGIGPLTVDRMLLLSGNETYSVNGSQFVAERWQGPRHITDESEFVTYDKMTDMNKGEKIGFYVKFRSKLTNKSDSGLSTFLSETGNPFANDYKNSKCEWDSKGSSKATLWIVDEKDGGKLKKVERSQSNGYANLGGNVHFRYYIDNTVDTPDHTTCEANESSSLFYRKTPMDMRVLEHNHVTWGDICDERIFAVYLYRVVKVNGSDAMEWFHTDFCFDEVCKQKEGLDIVDDDDIMEVNDPTNTSDTGVYKIKPLYMSYWDIQQLLFNLNTTLDGIKSKTNSDGDNNITVTIKLPGVKNTGYGNETYVFDRPYWESHNTWLLKKMAAIIYGYDDAHKKSLRDDAVLTAYSKTLLTLTNAMTEVKVYFSKSETEVGCLSIFPAFPNVEWPFYWEEDQQMQEQSTALSEVYSLYNALYTYIEQNDLDELEYIQKIIDLMDDMDDQNKWAAYYYKSFKDGEIFKSTSIVTMLVTSVWLAGIFFGPAGIAIGAAVQMAFIAGAGKGREAVQIYDAISKGDWGQFGIELTEFVYGFNWTYYEYVWDSNSGFAAGLKTYALIWGDFVTGGLLSRAITYFTGTPDGLLDTDTMVHWVRATLKVDDNGLYIVSEIKGCEQDDYPQITEGSKQIFTTLFERVARKWVWDGEAEIPTWKTVPLSTNKDRFNNASPANCGNLGHKGVYPTDINCGTSNLREGLCLGTPGVWRLPSGDIAIAITSIWGGKDGIVGGPNAADEGLENNDENNSENLSRCIKYVNKLPQIYFTSGRDKEIDKHWLKELAKADITEGNQTVLYRQTGLQSGYIFEQINNVCKNAIKLTLETTRPNVYTETTTTNIDVAKKW